MTNIRIDLRRFDEALSKIVKTTEIEGRVIMLLSGLKPVLYISMDRTGQMPFILTQSPVRFSNNKDGVFSNYVFEKGMIRFFLHGWWRNMVRQEYLSRSQCQVLIEDGKFLKGDRKLLEKYGISLIKEAKKKPAQIHGSCPKAV